MPLWPGAWTGRVQNQLSADCLLVCSVALELGLALGCGAWSPGMASPAESLQLTLHQVPPVQCLLCGLPASVIAQAPGSLCVEV